MQQTLIRLQHPVTTVRRGAVANLRRHIDGCPPVAADHPEVTAPLDANQANDHLTRAMERLANQCEAWREAMLDQVSEMQQLAVELGFTIAERLIHGEVHSARHDVRALVQAALAASGQNKPAVIFVSPADGERLQADEAARSTWKLPASIQISTDPSLEVGDLRAEFPGFELVFHWRRELAALRDQLLGEWDRSHSAGAGLTTPAATREQRPNEHSHAFL